MLSSARVPRGPIHHGSAAPSVKRVVRAGAPRRVESKSRSTTARADVRLADEWMDEPFAYPPAWLRAACTHNDSLRSRTSRSSYLPKAFAPLEASAVATIRAIDACAAFKESTDDGLSLRYDAIRMGACPGGR